MTNTSARVSIRCGSMWCPRVLQRETPQPQPSPVEHGQDGRPVAGALWGVGGLLEHRPLFVKLELARLALLAAGTVVAGEVLTRAGWKSEPSTGGTRDDLHER
jgi:hypothetical protein